MEMVLSDAKDSTKIYLLEERGNGEVENIIVE
jgi:hypothetical protein